MSIENEYTHGFHPYPAKFPPSAIRGFMKSYSEEQETILDPFCGSGTTLVECRLLDRNGVGIELNPVGVLVSRAKSAFYDTEDIMLLRDIIAELQNCLFDFNNWLSTNSSENHMPSYPNIDHWFQPHVKDELLAIKRSILDKYAHESPVSNLLKTAFSRIIVPVSNQDSETRYAAIEKEIPKGETLRLFLQTLSKYFRTLKDTMGLISDNASIIVIEGDTQNEIKTLIADSIDFVITSPPYINSFDYYLYHKHRIFWLGGEPRGIRKREIGGHHTIDSKTFDVALADYERSMSDIFQGINLCLKPRKHFAILIGDGIVKNRVINMDIVVEDIASKTGFELVSKDSSPLIKVSKVFIKGKNIRRKKHHVLVLRKT